MFKQISTFKGQLTKHRIKQKKYQSNNMDNRVPVYQTIKKKSKQNTKQIT